MNDARPVSAGGPADVPPDCLRLIDEAARLIEADESEWEAEIIAHLDDCPPCRTFLDQLDDLRTILRSLDYSESRG